MRGFPSPPAGDCPLVGEQLCAPRKPGRGIGSLIAKLVGELAWHVLTASYLQRMTSWRIVAEGHCRDRSASVRGAGGGQRCKGQTVWNMEYDASE